MYERDRVSRMNERMNEWVNEFPSNKTVAVFCLFAPIVAVAAAEQ